MRRWLCLGAMAALTACTGTDYIADPPMPVEPRLVVSPDMAAVQIGGSRSFSATYFDDTGTAVADAAVRWSVSDPAVASVDAAGTVSGLSEGQVRLVARVDGVASDSVLVGVVDDSDQVALVRLTASTAQLQPGETLQLTAAADNARGESLAGRTYTWRSSDENVVAVDADGLATALAPGRATLTAAVDGITSNGLRIVVPGGERAGTFVPRLSSRYDCEGSAVLRPDGDGGLEVVFGEDFAVSNGPRLEVFLSATEVVGPGSVNIGPLQATTGAQTYEVPADVALDTYNWVIIHCVPFNITFGFAQLR